MRTPQARYAVVREVPNSFERALRPVGSRAKIDFQLARRQHAGYCSALRDAGLEVLTIEADDRYPDCCFVEDTAIVIGDTAIISPMAAPTRRGESEDVETLLARFVSVQRLHEPATLDGGDVLKIGDRVFVGLSTRTNRWAAIQLNELLTPGGLEVIPVEIHDVLHLKSVCTHVADDLLLYRPGHAAPGAFGEFNLIEVREGEAHAANCISVNDRVLVPDQAPDTTARLNSLGLATLQVDQSEARKAGGLLSCSSILF